MKLLREIARLKPNRILGGILRRRREWWQAGYFRRFSRLPIQNLALFESFQGRVIGDSPYYLMLEALRSPVQLRLAWVVSPATEAAARTRLAELPRGAEVTLVRYGTVAWLRAIATASVLVNNTTFPGFFRKRSGQRFLQTWHGTPLKRLGFDIVGEPPTESYLTRIKREAAEWDALLVANRYSAEHLRSAFQYEGEVLCEGYPRNDLLSTIGDAERQAIRQRLGIAAGETVVLYAPTWRDYRRGPTGAWQAINPLGAEFAPPKGQRLLFRGHNNTRSTHSSAIAGSALDVTEYPNVTELLAITDVLITDYSSLMFDFAITGRPMIFYWPDAERYRGSRGFYFNLEDEAPGPIVEKVEGVSAALLALSSGEGPSNQAYDDWQKRFNALEDGAASQRILSTLLPWFLNPKE